MKPQLLIACDFDGTVTRQDTLVEILNAYGSSTWGEIQKKVVAGEMTVREGLSKEMSSVRASEKELVELLGRRVELEPTFVPFHKKMRAKGVPLILLSGGFDLCMETVLRKSGLWPFPFLANRLIRNNAPGGVSGPASDSGSHAPGGVSGAASDSRSRGSWQVEFPYPPNGCSACGHCKADPIKGWNNQGYTTVFIGNGVTDRCAAVTARCTFAKDELGSWCRKEGIAHHPYETFTDVEEELTKRGWL